MNSKSFQVLAILFVHVCLQHFSTFNRNVSTSNLENQLYSCVCDKAFSSYIPEAILPILKPKLLFKKNKLQKVVS
jgi:hypothetical protein